MKYLGDLVLQRNTESGNNFTLLRVFAATLVIFGHSFQLSPAGIPDPLRQVTGFVSGHVLGVMIFFTLSGFLVSASYQRSLQLKKYLTSRALRIYPGLLLCLGLTVLLIGPLFTRLTLGEYFLNPEASRYFLVNSSLASTAYSLPGVNFFAGAHGNSVNGSLWTIPLEVRLYLMIAVAGTTGILQSRVSTNFVIAVLAIIFATLPEYFPLIGPDSATYALVAFFIMGVGFFNNRNSIPVDWKILASMIFIAYLDHSPGHINPYLGACIVVYAVFCLAFAPKIKLPSWFGDYSYGIYLYGFPIQQMTTHFYPTFGPYKMMAIAIPASWLAGALSWHLVERPFLSFRKKL